MSFVPSYIKAIITNYFGHDVGVIAEALCAGPKPYPLLYRKVAEQLRNKSLFRKQLTILFWHSIVDMETRNGQDWYSITFENVFRFAMLPLQLSVLEQLSGPASFIIANVMVKAGRISYSDAVRQSREVAKGKPGGADFDFVKEFEQLVANKVFIRTKRFAGESEKDPFCLPSAILDGDSRIAQLTQVDAKMAVIEEELLAMSKDFGSEAAQKLDMMRRQKRKELFAAADKVVSTDSDKDILWRINFGIMDRIMRDRLLLELLINDCGIDTVGEKVMRFVLCLCNSMQDRDERCPTGKFFSLDDFKVLVSDNPDITWDDVESTLYLVSSSADSFIRRVADTKGGMYTIDYISGMRNLLAKVITSMIESKYDTEQIPEDRRGLASFIFTSLLRKGLVEEEKIAVSFKHPEDEIYQEIYRMRQDGFINVLTKDLSYEFNPMTSQFLYGVDLLRVNQNQFQHVLQFQANYINRRLYEKEDIKSVKQVKQKVVRMIEYAKQTCVEPDELEEIITDVSTEFDIGKRSNLRRYRQFKSYLRKVEMMLNKTIWIMHRNREMEQLKRKEDGRNQGKKSRKRAADGDDGPDAKRFAD